jgi:hypothetical protein
MWTACLEEALDLSLERLLIDDDVNIKLFSPALEAGSLSAVQIYPETRKYKYL